MKKRILSILLVLVMAFSMLPVTALAVDDDPPAPPVVYGSYDESGNWVEDPNSDGSYTDAESGITVSKTAESTGNPNEYTITLKVETGTTTTTVASEAATVLIIDVSGSMEFCAECGGDGLHKSSCKHFNPLWDLVTQDQSRMAAAKAAARSFIETYAGEAEGSGRYLAIVSFSTGASTVLGWTDVSTSEGKTSAKNAVNGLSAGGGTNLDDALRTATGLMDDNPVSSLENKFTVALTDGAPTFYINSRGETVGDGGTGSAETNAATAASAAILRQLCTLYTVCFGAAKEYCWNNGRNDRGPLVGDFLRDSIATPGCAYDAANTEALNAAFASITEDITSSIDISGASVTDPMASRIVFTPPEGVSGDRGGFKWVLSDPVPKEGGGYIYTLTYTITLDTTGAFDEDKYYPTNGDTYLTLADGAVIHFPVPAVKGTAPRYTVTWVDYDGTEISSKSDYHYGDTVTVPADPTRAPDATYTYTFAGWELVSGTALSDGKCVGNATYKATYQWELIPVPGLTVTKTANDVKASVGDTISWNITVKNTGNVDLTGITLTDTLKAAGDVTLYDANGRALPAGYTFSLGEGEEVKFTAKYKVTSADAGKTIYNTIVAAVPDGPGDTDTSDGTEIRPLFPVVPVLPTLNTEDHVAYIIGYADDTVRPENNITRAEVATIFFRLLTDSSREFYWTQKNDYSDVNRGDWFNNAVSTLSNAGIITGYPDGTFRPNAPITRAEFAAIAARFSDVAYSGKNTFSDVPDTHWAARFITLAEHLGWVAGYPDGTFRPDKAITRAEAMTLINRVLERAVDEKHMLPNMVTWIDNEPGTWYYEAVQEATNSHEYTRLTSVVSKLDFFYENWTRILPVPDWAALEKTWSDASSK